MPLPNFLVFGVPKAGTTTLYHYLAEHPEIFMSAQKEPGFFIFEGASIHPKYPGRQNKVTDFADYARLFTEAENFKAIGEATVGYYTSTSAIKRIQHYLDDIKLICVLRDPADRAYSHYLFAIQKGMELPGTTFEEAITRDSVQMPQGWTRNRPYVNGGYYARHLRPWIDAFGRERIKICFFSDLIDDHVEFAQDIYRFLEVEDSFHPQTDTQFAKSGIPKNEKLHEWLFRPSVFRQAIKHVLPRRTLAALRAVINPLRTRVANQNLEKPALPAAHRRHLIATYREDIAELEQLTGRDLSDWLTV